MSTGAFAQTVARWGTVVTGVDVAALDLSDLDLIDSIDAVHAFKQQVAALEADLIHACEQRDLARRDGSTSLPSWLSDRSRISPVAAHRLVDLARFVTDVPLPKHEVEEFIDA